VTGATISAFFVRPPARGIPAGKLAGAAWCGPPGGSIACYAKAARMSEPPAMVPFDGRNLDKGGDVQ